MSQSRITFTLNHLVSVLNSHADGILRTHVDLTFSQFLFLVSLRDGDKSLTEAAHYQGVSVAAVSKRIAWFVERGLVTCVNTPGKGNRSILSLTAKGRKLVDKSSDLLELQFRQALSTVKGIDLTKLEQQLGVLSRHFQNSADSKLVGR